MSLYIIIGIIVVFSILCIAYYSFKCCCKEKEVCNFMTRHETNVVWSNKDLPRKCANNCFSHTGPSEVPTYWLTPSPFICNKNRQAGPTNFFKITLVAKMSTPVQNAKLLKLFENQSWNLFKQNCCYKYTP